MAAIINTTGDGVPGREIVCVLGMVTGVAGGETPEPEGAKAVRFSALERMNKQAKEEMGADAVVGIHYDSAVFANNRVEYTAYGTAVKLR